MELWGLFTSAFLSSTLLPGGSEIILGVLARQNEHSLVTLVLLATLGNTLGGMTSWWFGYLLPNRLLRTKNYQKSINTLQRWGYPALFFSWLPIIGDPLCLAAGWLRLSFLRCLVFILAGKLSRYLMVVWLIKEPLIKS